jgi:large subunit ribosomal protein L14e
LPAIEVGRLCVKLSGREAGKKCVVVDVVDKSFVLITGPQSVSGVRRRRVNMNHIEPLEESVEIKRGASDEDVSAVLKKAGKLEDMAKPVSTNLP